MSRDWLKLGSLNGDMTSLGRPLLSEVEDSCLHVHVGYGKSTSSEQESKATAAAEGHSPAESVELPDPTDSLSPNITINNADRGSGKKKLVWADGLSTSVEDISTSPTFSSPDALLPHEVYSRPQSYILFEGREGEGEGFIHVKRDRSNFLGASIVSEGDITEHYKTDFVKVEVPTSNPDGSSITTAQELQICKRTVLKPFLIFLKLFGWRSFFMSRQDINPSRWVKLLNLMYPIVLFSLLVISCATQVVTCFYRDQPVQPVTSLHNGTILIDCSEDLFTRLIFPDILLLFAYVWGLYIFRFGAPEHLITLVETVFLSSQGIRKGQAKMVSFMRVLMLCGLLWVILDFWISIARVFSLQLLNSNSYLTFLSDVDPKNLSLKTGHTTSEQFLRFAFVIFDFFGFIFFDLLYIAVIVTYVAQCQLVRLYIGTIIDKVLLKLRGYTLEQAMTDIDKTYKFLQIVNGKLSALISVCLLVFVEAAVSSLYAVFKLKVPNGVNRHVVLGAVVGVANVILWCFVTMVPIVQAARLTSRCQQLRRLGLNVGHRPFAYHNTPQLLLDSFVQYTSATRYRAKLAGIPVYPSYVIGGLFLFILVGSFLIIFFPITRVAPWF